MNLRHRLAMVLLISAWISIEGRTARAEEVMPLFGPQEVEPASSGATVTKSPITKPPVAKPPVTSPDQEQPINQQTSSTKAAAKNANPPGGSSLPTRQAPEPSGEETSSDLQSQKEQRFRELKRQMEILSQLSNRPSATSASEVSSEDSTDASADSAQQGESYKSRRTVPAPDSLEPGSAASRLNTRAGTVAVPQLIPVRVPEEGAMTTPSPMVVEGTIDRFALATSLFGTQQWETCLDVLKHTDLTSLPREDQIWAEYMQACCHRRTGRNDLARQAYRRILSEKDADWIGQLASWWLDNLDAKAKLKTDTQRLSETLAAWENEIETLSKKSTRTATGP